jgi:hypothetical protein
MQLADTDQQHTSRRRLFRKDVTNWVVERIQTAQSTALAYSKLSALIRFGVLRFVYGLSESGMSNPQPA